jgi:hypothetical protein
MGAPMAHTPFTVADVISTWLAEGSDPDIVKGRLEFERDRLAAAEKRRAGMDNPSSLMVYNVLGGDEQEYARALKTDLVNARPELPEWNNERTKVREAMHKTKFDALEYARTQEVVKWGNHKEQRWVRFDWLMLCSCYAHDPSFPFLLSRGTHSKSQNGLATMLSILAKLVPDHPESKTDGEAREE